jgi:hypothetical protein
MNTPKMKTIDLAARMKGGDGQTEAPASYPEFSFSHDGEHNMPDGHFDMHMRGRVISHDKPRSPGGKHRYTIQATHLSIPAMKAKTASAHEKISQSLDKMGQAKIQANNPQLSAPGDQPPINTENEAPGM